MRPSNRLLIAAFCGALLTACSDTSGVIEPTLTTVADEPTTTESLAAGEGAAVENPASTEVEDTAEQTDTTVAAPALLTGTLTATIVNTHPHDAEAFTQGLELFDGRFIEGTGLYGESDRRVVDIDTGEVLQVERIDPQLFGEGITIVGNDIVQLTWKAGVVIRSDARTLVETGRNTYEGEGWGICYDGETLAMSNGSSSLTFRDPDTFAPIRSVEVTLDDTPVELLNELECVNGQVLANVWLSDLIVVIDPISGEVVATLDGTALRPAELPVEDSSFALNGIAHDPETGNFYLTGKRWPVIYEVELS